MQAGLGPPYWAIMARRVDIVLPKEYRICKVPLQDPGKEN